MANKSSVPPEVNEVRVLALNTCMEAFQLRNVDLVNAQCGTKEEITAFRKGKRSLTPYVLDRLYDNVFKAKGVRKEYLYANSKKDLACMTQEQYDFVKTYGDVMKASLELSGAKMTVLYDALKTVCESENIPEPNAVEFIKDSAFLSRQLEEEALRIAWSYIHRDQSPLWSLLKKNNS
jgi:hypothetical protein